MKCGGQSCLNLVRAAAHWSCLLRRLLLMSVLPLLRDSVPGLQPSFQADCRP